jgi:hypothetical protein
LFFIGSLPFYCVAIRRGQETNFGDFALEALVNNRMRRPLGSNSNARIPRTAVKCRPLPLLGGGAF